jgi:ADP-ribose pyrophosphatase YjhB (NUDIX family)
MFHEGLSVETPFQPEREQRRAYVAIVRFRDPQAPSVENLEMLLCRVKPPDTQENWSNPEMVKRIQKLLELHDFELWTIPGGGLNVQELKIKDEVHGARRAAVREVQEEIQVRIDPKHLELIAIGEVVSHVNGKSQTAHLFMAKEEHMYGDPTPGNEMNAVSWMKKDDLSHIRNLEAKRAFAFVAVALLGREILEQLQDLLGLPPELR